MKRLLIIATFLVSFYSFSQEDAWVYFSNKPNSQTYLNNPLTMLTQRALDRRTIQNIPLDINDVPIHQPYIDAIVNSTGITVKAKSKWMNCVHVRGSVTNISALALLTFVSQIKFANDALNSKNFQLKASKPINKKLDLDVTYNYGNSANQIQMLNGHLLHQANYTGNGKIIAVLDSGFIGVNTVAPFQNLFTNNQILGGYNYVAGNTNIYSTHNHGTMTLSCMAGFVDGQLVGTAPSAQYYLYITEDVAAENPVEESFWVEAAEEADRLGVDIISTSLGYFGYDNANYSHTYSDLTGNSAFASRGANIAFSKGIIVVASAGNSGATSDPYISVPAEATNVLAVGAVQANGSYASFSSIGPTFDGRVKPDVMAQGQNSVLSNTSGNIVTANGTSFSCPIMAGVIACLWQALPNFSNQQIVNLIKQSGNNYLTPNAQYGFGIPNFQTALNNALNIPNNSVIKFTTYPNPFDDHLIFEFPQTFKSPSLKIYNDFGQLVFNKENVISSEIINLKNLSSGLYIFKFEYNEETISGKLIKK